MKRLFIFLYLFFIFLYGASSACASKYVADVEPAVRTLLAESRKLPLTPIDPEALQVHWTFMPLPDDLFGAHVVLPSIDLEEHTPFTTEAFQAAWAARPEQGPELHVTFLSKTPGLLQARILVVNHGSLGSGELDYWMARRAFNAGFTAVAVVDHFTGRGLEEGILYRQDAITTLTMARELFVVRDLAEKLGAVGADLVGNSRGALATTVASWKPYYDFLGQGRPFESYTKLYPAVLCIPLQPKVADVPIYVQHGTQDTMTPLEWVQLLTEIYQAHGHQQVVLETFEGVGHAWHIAGDWILNLKLRALDWIEVTGREWGVIRWVKRQLSKIVKIGDYGRGTFFHHEREGFIHVEAHHPEDVVETLQDIVASTHARARQTIVPKIKANPEAIAWSARRLELHFHALLNGTWTPALFRGEPGGEGDSFSEESGMEDSFESVEEDDDAFNRSIICDGEPSEGSTRQAPNLTEALETL